MAVTWKRIAYQDELHTQNTDTALGAQSENLNMNTHQIEALSVPDAAGEAIRQTEKITEVALEILVDGGGGSGTHYVPLATSGDYTIPAGYSFIGGDEYSIEDADTLSIEGTGRMILVG